VTTDVRFFYRSEQNLRVEWSESSWNCRNSSSEPAVFQLVANRCNDCAPRLTSKEMSCMWLLACTKRMDCTALRSRKTFTLMQHCIRERRRRAAFRCIDRREDRNPALLVCLAPPLFQCTFCSLLFDAGSVRWVEYWALTRGISLTGANIAEVGVGRGMKMSPLSHHP
jgi:hypothetical protein